MASSVLLVLLLVWRAGECGGRELPLTGKCPLLGDMYTKGLEGKFETVATVFTLVTEFSCLFTFLFESPDVKGLQFFQKTKLIARTDRGFFVRSIGA